MPVFASSATSWKPGVTRMMRSSSTVGPVRHAAMDLSRRRIEARALIGPPGPQRFARAGIRPR